MDNGLIFPYQRLVAMSDGGTRQGRPERGSTVQAFQGVPVGKSAGTYPWG